MAGNGEFNLQEIGWGEKAKSISIGEGLRVEMCEIANCVNNTDMRAG